MKISSRLIEARSMAMVYAAQPREGTETLRRRSPRRSPTRTVYAAQPREGTETLPSGTPPAWDTSRFMQLNPARGRKQFYRMESSMEHFAEVYAAQPREGTETAPPLLLVVPLLFRGLCSSTPRGDGNLQFRCSVHSISLPGLCSSTPRGDGN